MCCLVFACQPLDDQLPLDEPLGVVEQRIGEGRLQPELFGGALVIDGPAVCSGVFLESDLVATHADCVTNKTVVVSGSVYAVKLGRSVPGAVTLATLQLRKEVTSIFLPGLTRRPVQSGETLSCFGFDATRAFTSGTFKVRDVSGSQLFLEGGASHYMTSFSVEETDLGGACFRDGATEAVAILTGTTNGTIATAVQVDSLLAARRDLMNAVVASRTQGAVTLVDDPGLASPLALGVNATGTLLASPRVSTLLSQAFYLVPLTAPRVVAMVNAETGRCLAAMSPPRAVSCDFANPQQHWEVASVSTTAFSAGFRDGYRFRSMVPPSPCLTVGGATTSCSSQGTTLGLWLNPY